MADFRDGDERVLLPAGVTGSGVGAQLKELTADPEVGVGDFWLRVDLGTLRIQTTLGTVEIPVTPV